MKSVDKKSERCRQAFSQSRCAREVRRADEVRRRHRAAAHAVLQDPAQSHLPHALIKSIDVSKALALPGVFAVITGKDLPIPYGILPVSQDEHALCIDKVRFIGDPVAAVAAIDEDVAFDAMNLIEVEYEPLNTISSIEEAVLIDEPRIHDYGDGGNIHKKVSLEFGNVEEGFAEADLVREDTFFYEGNTHLPMEQHAAVAHFDPDEKDHALEFDANAALRSSRAGKSSWIARQSHSRDCHAKRRRLWRQERSVQSRSRGLQALDDHRASGEGDADARRSFLLSSWPPSGVDARQDRREERRRDHRDALSVVSSTAALTAVTASRARSTPARCKR